jgi:hypothetical protein
MKERFISACEIIHAFTVPLMVGGLILLILLQAAPAVSFN